jgi:hypothetical protein
MTSLSDRSCRYIQILHLMWCTVSVLICVGCIQNMSLEHAREIAHDESVSCVVHVHKAGSRILLMGTFCYSITCMRRTIYRSLLPAHVSSHTQHYASVMHASTVTQVTAELLLAVTKKLRRCTTHALSQVHHLKEPLAQKGFKEMENLCKFTQIHFILSVNPPVTDQHVHLFSHGRRLSAQRCHQRQCAL